MHVLVTGASSGIGQAIAKAYLAAGDKVSVVARRKSNLDELVTLAPSRATAIAANLADLATCDAVISAAIAAHGPIDVLINNAGVQIVDRLIDTAIDQAEQMLALNLLAPLRLTKAVLPSMIARRTGTIVDISSMAAITPTPTMTYYSASKAGIGAASEALRAEVKPHGVHVVTVYPGPVATDMETRAREKLEATTTTKYLPTGNVDELARLIQTAVSKKQARVIYPKSYASARHFPNLSRWLLDRATPNVRSR